MILLNVSNIPWVKMLLSKKVISLESVQIVRIFYLYKSAHLMWTNWNFGLTEVIEQTLSVDQNI